MVCSRSTLSPSASPGTTKALMPLEPGSPVRANTTYSSASPALPMKRFSPLSTHTSPRFSARAWSAAGSEPTPASVSA